MSKGLFPAAARLLTALSLAAGGGYKDASTRGDYVIAYTLPR